MFYEWHEPVNVMADYIVKVYQSLRSSLTIQKKFLENGIVLFHNEWKKVNRVWLFCDPMDHIPPGSSVHVVFQARILKWVAILFDRDLPNPGIKLMSPALQADSLPLSHQGSLLLFHKRRSWWNSSVVPFDYTIFGIYNSPRGWKIKHRISESSTLHNIDC